MEKDLKELSQLYNSGYIYVNCGATMDSIVGKILYNINELKQYLLNIEIKNKEQVKAFEEMYRNRTCDDHSSKSWLRTITILNAERRMAKKILTLLEEQK